MNQLPRSQNHARIEEQKWQRFLQDPSKWYHAKKNSHISTGEFDICNANMLVDSYAKSGRMLEAYTLFNGMVKRNVVSWNTIISGYAQNGSSAGLALELVARMQNEGFHPNSRTFVAALNACSCMASLKKGIQVHSILEACGENVDVFVSTALVNMYGKCGKYREAKQVFDKVPVDHRDSVIWTAMISVAEAYTALELFESMQSSQSGAVPNARTFVAVLGACASLGHVEKGMAIHAEIIKMKLHSNVLVGNSLMDMYSKCGSMRDAQCAFNGVLNLDAVSWNIMILGYTKNGEAEFALELFHCMECEGNQGTAVAVIKACCELTEKELLSLERCFAIHAHFDTTSISIQNSLMHLYAKSGSIQDSVYLFKKMCYRDVVSWNILIEACGDDAAVQHFKTMDIEGFTPDVWTFTFIFKACGKLGLLETGRRLHEEAVQGEVHRVVEVANSIITFYGKCGCVPEAQQVFDSLCDRNLMSWSAIIAAYSHQGDAERVFGLFEQMQEFVRPDGITLLSVLSVCCYSGLVDRGRECFENMRADYGIAPGIEHYLCMVGLFGRADRLDDAVRIVKSIPAECVSSRAWMTLLGACSKWENIQIGRTVFEALQEREDHLGTAYALMANICSKHR